MIREVEEKDLESLLNLYTQLHDNSIPELTVYLTDLWKKMLSDRNYHIIIAIEDGMIVSSCVIIIIPNLTHNQQPYALIENVITDRNNRKRGLATACLNYAKEIAIKGRCYKIMLLTGSKKKSTIHFYENAGFNKNDKTGFIQWL